MLASATSRLLAAAAVMLGLGACTTVLALDPYQGASDGICGLLDGCYADGALGDCRAHVDATLGGASAKEGTGWLTALSDQGCLDTCTSARTCLDLSPICVQGACQAREDCCGFSKGLSDCEEGRCCRAVGQPCGDDSQCCASAGACVDGHCGGVVCRDPGVACGLDEQCCSQHCQRDTKTCATLICGDDGFECATGEDCCSRFCDAGKRCATPACSELGQTCQTLSDCCAGASFCFELDGVGFCSADTCLPDEVLCTRDADCCGNHCDVTFDRCSSTCVADQGACSLDADCCSGSCDVASATCASGCSAGDCAVDSDCCSGKCIADTCAQQCVTGQCGDHLVCDVGGPLPPGCDGPKDCVAEVCEADPHCCCEGWDSVCVYEALHPLLGQGSACLKLCL